MLLLQDRTKKGSARWDGDETNLLAEHLVQEGGLLGQLGPAVDARGAVLVVLRRGNVRGLVHCERLELEGLPRVQEDDAAGQVGGHAVPWVDGALAGHEVGQQRVRDEDVAGLVLVLLLRDLCKDGNKRQGKSKESGDKGRRKKASKGR